MSTEKWTIIVFAVFALALALFKAWNKDTRGAFLIGGLVVLFGLLFFVAGCSVRPEYRPWMEVGMAYDFQGTVGSDPACIVRLRQPIGFGPIKPEWLLVGYVHHSSCRDQYDRNTIDQLEVTAKIPIGRSK